jgi:2-polyprenyl-3-methyl-5-hydroxy-6-metoxy-1,4-benzoquinol methylase
MFMSNNTDFRTLEYYAREAPVYVASGPGGVCRHLHLFLERVPPEGSILELGCGGGLDSEEMLKLGFKITPTDGVPEVARKAEQRLGIPVRVMRFDELNAPMKFDAVWAHAALLHVPRASLPGVLERIHKSLKPGGHHFASFKSGGIEARDNHGRYFNHVSRKQLLDAYALSGRWEVLNVNEYTSGGYENGQGPWIAITVRKT